MFKYIGIRGHRGAGKNTIGYLLGTAIEFYLQHENWDGFDAEYNKAVEKVIMEGAESLPEYDFKRVYLESFADTAKVTLAQILGIPVEWMYNDYVKDNTIFDIENFSYRRAQNKLDFQAIINSSGDDLFDAETLYKEMLEGNIFLKHKHVYITLRELISYYSKCVMQKFFGRSVWVKSQENTRWEIEKFYASNKTIYKIFVDCKFPTEISYIYKNNGKIVKINRINNTKTDTNISEALADDDRFDFEINLNGDLYSQETVEKIKEITLKILSE